MPVPLRGAGIHLSNARSGGCFDGKLFSGRRCGTTDCRSSLFRTMASLHHLISIVSTYVAVAVAVPLVKV